MTSRPLILLPALLLALTGCGSPAEVKENEPVAAATATQQSSSTVPAESAAEGKVVALVPGIYTPYNTHFPDIDRYYEDPSSMATI